MHGRAVGDLGRDVRTSSHTGCRSGWPMSVTALPLAAAGWRRGRGRMRAGRGGTSKGDAGEGREDELMSATGFDPAGAGYNASPHTLGDRDRLRGLYDPALDKDSCGVGFIADIKGRKSHQIVEDGLRILCNLEHRGAVGADPRMGDGAGILVQIPHKFFAKKAAELRFKLPPAGEYAVAQ